MLSKNRVQRNFSHKNPSKSYCYQKNDAEKVWKTGLLRAKKNWHESAAILELRFGNCLEQSVSLRKLKIVELRDKVCPEAIQEILAEIQKKKRICLSQSKKLLTN